MIKVKIKSPHLDKLNLRSVFIENTIRLNLILKITLLHITQG